MKYFTLFSSFILSLFLASSAYSAPVAQEGQDNKVEWQFVKRWQISGKTLDMVHSLDGKYIYMLNDKNQVQIYNNSGILQGSVPVTKGVSAIDIAPQGEVLYLINNNDNSFSSVDISFVQDIDVTGSPFEGPADAPITIAVFTDFECPYCSKLVPLIEQVREKNHDKVKVVLKNMPLRFHKMAEPGARAALAAHEQGKFWEFHDRLFAEKKLTEGSITNIAKSLELDMAKFEADMKSGKIKAKLQKDIRDAKKAGVTGTPTVFINGRKAKKRSVAGYQAVIDDELRKLGLK